MTVSYTSSYSGRHFLTQLFRWRGSIYKLVLPDLIFYVLIYYGINLTYRYYLADLPGNSPHRERFHMAVTYCEYVVRIIPLEFLLGFYISTVVTRWWTMYMTIPWPDTLALIVAASVHGEDERGRLYRRTLIRYVNLCILFCFRMLSPQSRKRFPTLDHMVAAGFLLPHEKRIIDRLDEKLEGPKFYVPLVWAACLCAKARKEGRINDDFAVFNMVKYLNEYRDGIGFPDILVYDWVATPVVYTQVVTLAVYIYFLAFMIAKQQYAPHVDDPDNQDVLVPLFDFLKFFFTMGWLKVAEVLINPFGEDDDDFEVNWLVDRNLKISYLIVDEMNSQFPELRRDPFWDNVLPSQSDMYYTKEARMFNSEGYAGSMANSKEKFTGSKRKSYMRSQRQHVKDHSAQVHHNLLFEHTHVVRKISSTVLVGGPNRTSNPHSI